MTPEPVRWVWRALRGRAKVKRKDNSLVNHSFAQCIGFAERTKALLARYTLVWTQREEHWLGLSVGIISCIHEELNKTAAPFGIETRHPFWDRRLVEFCLALPPEQKLHQGWPRWILRRAMTNILPDEIQWRVGKSNLSANFNRSLLAFERERLEQVLVRDPTLIEEYVDISVLHEAYQRGDANTIWPAVILALWLRQTGLTSKTYNKGAEVGRREN